MTSPSLTVRNASVEFGGVQALDGVSLDLLPGELLGLIGPNGAGKTTLMRLVTGLIRAPRAAITLAGQTVGGLSLHARVRLGLAMSQQLVRPFTSMTIADNVTLAAGGLHTQHPLRAFLSISREGERRRAEILLERLGLSALSSKRPAEVPLGVLKRLEVARALATQPRVLLLDEPLAGLNHVEAAALADTIRDIADSGIDVLLIEHNLAEVMRICTRLMVLDSGRVLAAGRPQSVLAEPSVRAAYLGEESVK